MLFSETLPHRTHLLLLGGGSAARRCCPQPFLLYSPSRVCVPSPALTPQGSLGLWFLSGLRLVGLIYERSPHLALSPGPPPPSPLLPPTPPLPDCLLSFPQSQDFPGAGGSSQEQHRTGPPTPPPLPSLSSSHHPCGPPQLKGRVEGRDLSPA